MSLKTNKIIMILILATNNMEKETPQILADRFFQRYSKEVCQNDEQCYWSMVNNERLVDCINALIAQETEMLRFELKAADADYQKQIKDLKIQYSNDLNEACSYLDSIKGSVDVNGMYMNKNDFIGIVVAKLKKSLDDNLKLPL